jgi:hypothetical protein
MGQVLKQFKKFCLDDANDPTILEFTKQAMEKYRGDKFDKYRATLDIMQEFKISMWIAGSYAQKVAGPSEAASQTPMGCLSN